MPTIALCTAPKPFTDPTIDRIQRNALRSWRALGDAVETFIVGEEAGAEGAARREGCGYIPDVERNASGTPLIRSIFDQTREASPSPILAYANADIILLGDFLDVVGRVAERLPRFLLVSRRWDLRFEEDLATGTGWEDRLRARIAGEGRRHPPGGSDVFAFPRGCFVEVPALAVGRAGWDNWMIFEARRRRWPVVDVSEAMTVVHQDHDYRHLPGGRPHYRLPETEANVRIAGGRRAILSLQDADWRWSAGEPTPKPTSLASLAREIELFPVLRLGSPTLANLTFALFHPRKALGELRGWVAWKAGDLRRRSALEGRR